MVIAPPSIKPDGGAYRWVCEAEITEAPNWLLALAAFTGGADTEAHVPNPEKEAPLPLIKAALNAIL
jgi:Bifunctional DNA primase/polymerase, N-terminal